MHVFGVFFFRIPKVLTVFTLFLPFLISQARAATSSNIPQAKRGPQNAWEKMEKIFVLYVAHSMKSAYARICMCMHVHDIIH